MIIIASSSERGQKRPTKAESRVVASLGGQQLEGDPRGDGTRQWGARRSDFWSVGKLASRSRLCAIFGNVLLVACGSLVGLVLLEAGLRIGAPTSDAYHIWPPHLRSTFETDARVILGLEGRNSFRVNSRGLRAEELAAEHDFRVLAFGGSTTECWLLDQSEAWPYLVQELLSEALVGREAWVGNAGASGHNSREHVFQVPRLLAAYPETDVALVLVGVNDLGLRLQQDDDYDPLFLDREDIEDDMIPRAFRHYPLEFRDSLPFYKRLELYARLRHIKNLASMLLGRGEVTRASSEGIVGWRKNRRNATRIRTQLPDLDAALAEYRRNLLRISASAEAAGVPLVLMTQPHLWRADLSEKERELVWWGGVGDFMAEGARAEFYSVEAMAEGMDRYNQTLLSVCSETGAHCLDLASMLPKDTSIFFDGVHFHEQGARSVAELVADFLLGVVGKPSGYAHKD